MSPDYWFFLVNSKYNFEVGEENKPQKQQPLPSSCEPGKYKFTFLSSKGINVARITPLDRLAIVGSNGMGALAYKPEIESREIKSTS